MKVNSETVAYITGGAKGIGLAIAEAILERGGKVYLVDINQKDGDNCVASLSSRFDKSHICFECVNIVQQEKFYKSFHKAVSTFGHVTALFNNAGIGDRIQFDSAEADGEKMPSEWTTIIDVNLTAVINGTRVAVNYFLKNKRQGVIVNTSSLGGFFPQPYSTVYCATKHAVIGFTRSMSHLRHRGVRVVALCPGFTETNLVASGHKNSPAFRKMIEATTQANGGLMPVKDVAEVGILLLEEESLAGQTVSVSRELGVVLHEAPVIKHSKSTPTSDAKKDGLTLSIAGTKQLSSFDEWSAKRTVHLPKKSKL